MTVYVKPFPYSTVT